MKRLISILALMFICTPFALCVESLISGKVLSRGKAVEGVIVRLTVDGRDVSYDITNSEGLFKISYSGSANVLKLVCSHLSFETKELTLDNKSQNLTVSLEPKVTKIKEITVTAPDVRLRGDTLIYNLGAFTKESDVTLEDALKNLPGIEVAKSGKISYMGKDLSHFYVEGMDLLGGRYSIATTNITPDMVSTVEVMENHQPIKIMQKKMLSDAVAMNIKLKKEAKLKPKANIEAGIGYAEPDAVYRLGLTGMLFSKKFQTISTIKFGTVGEQSSAAAQMHFVEIPAVNNLAMNIVATQSGSTPPLDNGRFTNTTDGLASINTINKFSEDDELRINANYTYTNEDYNYSQLSDYYVDDTRTIVDENNTPKTLIHNPSLEVKYNRNSDKIYLNNTIKGDVSILDNGFNTLNSGSLIAQSREALGYNVTNNFNIRKPIGSRTLGFSSTISYLATPNNSVSYTSALDENYNYIQNANGRTFYTNNTFDYSFLLSPNTQLFLPVTLKYTNNNIQTTLSGRDTQPNDLKGGELRTAISPRLEYKAPSGRFEMTATAPVGYSYMDYNQATQKYNSFLYSPSVAMKFILSPSSNIRLNGGASNSIGDATSFLVNPIQTSYRTASIASGILAENTAQSATLSYQYKMPLSHFYLNTSVGYIHSMRNLLPSQWFSGEDIISTQTLGDNQSEGFNAQLHLSKLFKSIKTKVDLGGFYSLSNGEVMQQNILTEYTSAYYGANLTLTTTPLNWLEFSYTGSLSINNSKFLSTASTVTNHSHRARLTFLPTKNLHITLSGDYVNNQVSPTKYVDMFLLDLEASYKFKKFTLGLALTNILDTKQYAYTVFNGLDTFSYNYTLYPRELVLYFRFL